MRRLVVISLVLFLLALSLFSLADRQRADAAGAYDLRGATNPNLIHEIVAPDSPVSPGFRCVNFIAFALLAASAISLAADRRSRHREYD